MKYKAINSKAIDIKKSEIGSVYIGTYQGKKEIETKLGKQIVWNLIDDDGVPYSIYGFTNLNRAMETVIQGTGVRITYKGTQKMTTNYGVKDVHQVLVEIAVEEDSDEMPPMDDEPE